MPNQDNDTVLEEILEVLVYTVDNVNEKGKSTWEIINARHKSKDKRIDQALAQIKAHHIAKSEVESAIDQVVDKAWLRHKLGLGGSDD